MGRAMGFLWLLAIKLIGKDRLHAIVLANGQTIAWCLVMRDQSAAMLTTNYFFIFCILIKN